MRNNKRPGSDPLNLLPESFSRCSKNWVLVHWQSNWSDCPPPPPPTHPFESSLALKIRMHTSHLRFLPLATGFWGPPLAPKGPGQILGGGFRGGKAPQQKINLRVLVFLSFLIRNFVILPVTLMKILACMWYYILELEPDLMNFVPENIDMKVHHLIGLFKHVKCRMVLVLKTNSVFSQSTISYWKGIVVKSLLRQLPHFHNGIPWDGWKK